MKYENENQKKRKTGLVDFFERITIGKVFKFIVIVLIASVYVLLIGRMLLARNYGVMDRYVWTENAVSAYIHSPDNFSVMTQQLSESIDTNGLYHISNFVYVPEIKELQLTVRYNNSTLDKLDVYYPGALKAGETFVFTLEDSNGKIYDSYRYASSSNLIYNFRRVVFEGVDIENSGTLYLNVYYVNDTDIKAPMSVSFRLYDNDLQPYESDIKINYKTTADKLFASPMFAYDA